MSKHARGRRLRREKADLTCRRVTALIVDYLAGAMDRAAMRGFEQHLRDCPDCVAFLNTYKKSIGALRSLRYPDIPLEMRRRVRQFLRERIVAGLRRG